MRLALFDSSLGVEGVTRWGWVSGHIVGNVLLATDSRVTDRRLSFFKMIVLHTTNTL